MVAQSITEMTSKIQIKATMKDKDGFSFVLQGVVLWMASMLKTVMCKWDRLWNEPVLIHFWPAKPTSKKMDVMDGQYYKFAEHFYMCCEPPFETTYLSLLQVQSSENMVFMMA